MSDTIRIKVVVMGHEPKDISVPSGTTITTLRATLESLEVDLNDKDILINSIIFPADTEIRDGDIIVIVNKTPSEKTVQFDLEGFKEFINRVNDYLITEARNQGDPNPVMLLELDEKVLQGKFGKFSLLHWARPTDIGCSLKARIE